MRQNLDDLAASLNVNGNQNIAKLQMSIDDGELPEQTNGINGDTRAGRLDARNAKTDSRIPYQNGRAHTVEADEDEEGPLDISFFPTEGPNAGRRKVSSKKPHIFGKADAYRGEDERTTKETNDFDGQERARRRAAGLSIVHRYVYRLPIAAPELVCRLLPHLLGMTTQSAT